MERTAELKDGTVVVLRSLRKEDEPSISGMFRSCSPETLRQRYQYSFRPTPEWIAGLCRQDRSREIAVVAEVTDQGAHRLVGLLRLALAPDQASAELGILITDDWQGKGLGTLMVHHGLEVAKKWGAKCVTAVTTPDNHRMIKLFRNEGFAFDDDWHNGIFRVHKELSFPVDTSGEPHWKETRLKQSA
jgi:acetyltransferase